MNKNQRKTIDGWKESLEEIKSGIEEMQEEENGKYENLPEGIQDSDRGTAMYEGVENLEAAANSLDEAIDYLSEAQGEG